MLTNLHWAEMFYSDILILNVTGCGALYVADGSWKLRHLHCMWKVPVEIKGFGQINYPSVCPLTPVRGKAFCTIHVAAAEKQQIKTDLKAFLKTCGLDDDDYCDSDGRF